MGITPSATKSLLLSATVPVGTSVDAYLVTTAVVDANSTVAAITQASGGNYSAQSPQTITSTAPSISGTAAILSGTPTTLTWTNLFTTTATPIVGLAFAKRVGGSSAGTDPIIGYSALSFSTPVAACTTTNGSEIVSTTNSFTTAGYVKGQLITGSNIPLGTVIGEVTSATQLILSQAATSSIAGSLTVSALVPSPYTPPTSANTSTLTAPLPATGILALL